MSWLDFLKPRVLEEFESRYTGPIQVMQLAGDRYITTGSLTQSGDLVREVWQKTLHRLSRPHGKSWAILGLAGGTLAKYISAENHPSEIVGVEIDPVMVEIGKKYFNLSGIPELKIICQDAFKFLAVTHRKFDRILVDMYYGDTPPEFIYSSQFIKLLVNRINAGGVVVFNHLYYEPAKIQSAGKLVNLLKEYFPDIKLERKLTNLLISCSRVYNG